MDKELDQDLQDLHMHTIRIEIRGDCVDSKMAILDWVQTKIPELLTLGLRVRDIGVFSENKLSETKEEYKSVLEPEDMEYLLQRLRKRRA